MRPTERQNLIVDHVEKHGSVTVDSLAQTLTISRETIRRDLSALADRGQIRKFHGGARIVSAIPPDQIGEGQFHARMCENVPQKRRIAKAAAALFKPGDSLFIDTGSTTVFFAEELRKLSGLTVITNSSMIAHHVSNGHGNRVFVVGGEYRDSAGENVGRLAVEQIRTFKAEHIVLTVGALDLDGISDFDPEEAEVARAMIAQGRILTIIIDRSKLSKTGVFQVCPLNRIQRIVIDQRPGAPLAAGLSKADIEVVVAN